MRRAALLALLPVLAAAAPRSPGVSAQRDRLAALSAREAQLAQRIGANRTTLLKLLSALEMWRRDPPPALLVSPQRAQDAARAAILMRAIAPELQRRANILGAQARELAAVRRQAAEAGAQLFAQESAAADRSRGSAGEEALLSPAERARMAQARGDPLALGAPEPHAALQPPPALVAPVAGAPIRRFGQPWPGRGRSEGWSWAPPPNAPVRAPADGEVEYAGPLRSWRLVAILRLAGGWRLVLAGLQSETAPLGALVHAGDVIGQAPPASKPAPEVYLELRRGAEPVDPVDPGRMLGGGDQRR